MKGRYIVNKTTILLAEDGYKGKTYTYLQADKLALANGEKLLAKEFDVPKLTLPELKAMGKEQKIKGYTKMSAKELNKELGL